MKAQSSPTTTPPVRTLTGAGLDAIDLVVVKEERRVSPLFVEEPMFYLSQSSQVSPSMASKDKNLGYEANGEVQNTRVDTIATRKRTVSSPPKIPSPPGKRPCLSVDITDPFDLSSI